MKCEECTCQMHLAWVCGCGEIKTIGCTSKDNPYQNTVLEFTEKMDKLLKQFKELME